MSFDRVLLFFHILGGGTWLGGGILIALLAIRARQVGKEMEMIQQMEWVGNRIVPAVLVTLASGVWMVFRNSAFQFTQLWILVALALFAVLFFMGVGFHVPQYKRIYHAREEHGDDSPMVQRLINQSFIAARVEVILIALVIFLMVFKPVI
jgi:uncharacterized membrane protein